MQAQLGWGIVSASFYSQAVNEPWGLDINLSPWLGDALRTPEVLEVRSAALERSKLDPDIPASPSLLATSLARRGWNKLCAQSAQWWFGLQGGLELSLCVCVCVCVCVCRRWVVGIHEQASLLVNLGLPQRTKILAKNIPIVPSPSTWLVFVNVRELPGWESVGPKLQASGTALW